MVRKFGRLPLPQKWKKTRSFLREGLPFSERIKLFFSQVGLPVLVVALFSLVLIPVVTYFYFVQDLISKETIMNRNDTGVLLLDRNGKPFYSFYEAKQKTVVPINQISSDLQNAVIAVEDKGFYSHSGFSLRSIAAAFWADIVRKQWRYGGSTITQQLVKNVLLSHEKNFLRKYQELVLAMEIERRFSKKEILEMYLNSVYFGEGAYGIENAADTYFGKHAKDLTLAESSLLAGLPVAPSALSPISGDKEKALERQKFVLTSLEEGNYISEEQKQQASKIELKFRPKEETSVNQAAHFALMVREQLIKQFGEEKISRSGFKVYTTLDLDWQSYAEEQVNKQVKDLAVSHVTNGAAVVQDPKTGEVKAYVGSFDWYNDKFGKVNIPMIPRQPGSSFKPIVYSAAFEKHLITPGTILHDVPTAYPQPNGKTYEPKDYDNKFRGDVLVRRALANSLNIPAVEVLNKIGIPSALDMAKRLGITTLKETGDYGLSLVLGAGEVPLLEMTGVYAVFANAGEWAEPVLISKIVDKNGKTVFTHTPKSNRVLDPQVSFLISSILSDNKTRAEEFGNALNISRDAAVKTGTTNDYKDSWTIGYTPSLVVGVWVGNNDNTPMDKIAGSMGAAPIWRNLMERYLKGTPIESFSPPSGVTQETICRFNGLKLSENFATSSAFKEYFILGTEPTQVCYITTPTPTSSPSPSDVTPTTAPTNVPTSGPHPTDLPLNPNLEKIKVHRKKIL